LFDKNIEAETLRLILISTTKMTIQRLIPTSSVATDRGLGGLKPSGVTRGLSQGGKLG